MFLLYLLFFRKRDYAKFHLRQEKATIVKFTSSVKHAYAYEMIVIFGYDEGTHFVQLDLN